MKKIIFGLSFFFALGFGTVEAKNIAIFQGGYGSQNYACGIKSDKSIICWGSYSDSIAGNYLDLSAWGCGVKSDGSINCFNNLSGQYTNESNVKEIGYSPSVISNTYNGEAILYKNGDLVTYASNINQSNVKQFQTSWGSLGLILNDGTLKFYGTYVGGGWPPVLITQLDGYGFTKVSVGGNSFCGLYGSGFVFCGGQFLNNSNTDGFYGKLYSDIAVVNPDSYAVNACGIRIDNKNIECYGSDQGANEKTPPSGEFVEIAGGRYSYCGIKTDGSVVCWGYNGGDIQTIPSGLTLSLPSSGGGETPSGEIINSYKIVGSGGTITCDVKKFIDITKVKWYTDFGSLPATLTGGDRSKGEIFYKDKSGSRSDYMLGVNFYGDSTLPHEVFAWTNTGPVVEIDPIAFTGGGECGFAYSFPFNLNYLCPPVNNPLGNTQKVRIYYASGGYFQNINVVQTKGSKVVQGTEGPVYFGGALTFDWWALPNYGNPYEVASLTPCGLDGSGGCTGVYNGFDANSVDIYIDDGAKAFRIGYGTGYVLKTECRNDSYSCHWYYNPSATGGYVCSGNGFDKNGKAIFADCNILELTGSGECVPSANFRAPGIGEEYIVDGSGNVIGIGPTNTNQTAKKEKMNGIFSCPSSDWPGSFQCILHIAGNIWDILTTGNTISDDDTPQTIQGQIKRIGNSATGSSQNYGNWSETGSANFADMIIRKAWNKTLDSNDQMMRFAISAWYGVIFMVFVLIVVGIILFSKNIQK